MYIHYLKNWEAKPLPEINTDFCINGKTYRIAPSTLHGVGIFIMDSVKVPYKSEVGLMDYVGPTYDYAHWAKLTRYLTNMLIYGFYANYNKMKKKIRIKHILYI